MSRDPIEEGRRRLAAARQRQKEQMERARERVLAMIKRADRRRAEAEQRRGEMMEEARRRFARGAPRPGTGYGKRRRPGKDMEEGGVPAVPDRPRDLSGGAAAELDFEDR